MAKPDKHTRVSFSIISRYEISAITLSGVSAALQRKEKFSTRPGPEWRCLHIFGTQEQQLYQIPIRLICKLSEASQQSSLRCCQPKARACNGVCTDYPVAHRHCRVLSAQRMGVVKQGQDTTQRPPTVSINMEDRTEIPQACS